MEHRKDDFLQSMILILKYFEKKSSTIRLLSKWFQIVKMSNLSESYQCEIRMRPAIYKSKTFKWKSSVWNSAEKTIFRVWFEVLLFLAEFQTEPLVLSCYLLCYKRNNIIWGVPFQIKQKKQYLKTFWKEPFRLNFKQNLS